MRRVLAALLCALATGCSKQPPAWLLDASRGTGDADASGASSAATRGDGAGGEGTGGDTVHGDTTGDSAAQASGLARRDGSAERAGSASIDVLHAEAQARLRALVAAHAAPEAQPDCAALVEALEADLALALPRAHPPSPAADGGLGNEARVAYGTFAVCARHARRWTLLRHLGELLAPDGSPRSVAFLARALIGLGTYDAAARPLLPLLHKAWPKEPDALVAGAVAACRVEDDDTCLARADEAIAALKGKTGIAAEDLVAEARAARAEATARKGRDLPKDVRLGARVDALDVVPASLLALVGKPPLGPLATVHLANFASRTLPVRIEVAVPGVTQTAAKDLVFGGKKDLFRASPPPSPLFDPTLAAALDAKLMVTVTETTGAKRALFEETRPLRVLARDELPLFVHPRDGETRRTRELLLTAVAPADKEVAALADAARGLALSDLERTWETLRARGFAFHRAPTATEGRPIETVRSMAEVIRARGGSAREGSLLFASVLTALGADAVVVDAPGDTFAGVVTQKGASSNAVTTPLGEASFVEITALGARPFATAELRANAEYVDLAADDAFGGDRAALLRTRGPLAALTGARR